MSKWEYEKGLNVVQENLRNGDRSNFDATQPEARPELQERWCIHCGKSILECKKETCYPKCHDFGEFRDHTLTAQPAAEPSTAEFVAQFPIIKFCPHKIALCPLCSPEPTVTLDPDPDNRAYVVKEPTGARQPAFKNPALVAMERWDKEVCGGKTTTSECSSFLDGYAYAASQLESREREIRPRYDEKGILWYNGLGHMTPADYNDLKHALAGVRPLLLRLRARLMHREFCIKLNGGEVCDCGKETLEKEIDAVVERI